MAGVAKPSVSNLGAEAKYTVLGGRSNGDSTTGYMGLFDGVTINEYNTSRVHYFSAAGDYVEIDITSKKVNIWRSGTSSWLGHTRTLAIKYWNGSSYVDVTSFYTQSTSAIGQTKWEKTIYNLPKGRYRFEYNPTGTGGTYRLDSEWYIENLITDKILLSSGGKTQSIKDGLINLPSSDENNFIKYGMDSPVSISPTYSKITDVVSNNTALGSGKVFEHSIDLAKQKANKITFQ